MINKLFQNINRDLICDNFTQKETIDETTPEKFLERLLSCILIKLDLHSIIMICRNPPTCVIRISNHNNVSYAYSTFEIQLDHHLIHFFVLTK